ncbi:PspC domain-containing protein [Salipaludibacillus sp. LMS25]|jgi:phage shock protein PspC (stress-responsive transcriptional regulator)|uniref:PspC domain-containing protein n=1 Tax=Salipaludibacillus sp. LMS25 TaxID=2924031 RepID=UPI0020D11130|nr:PspC domain-containing protein [Salipaludibacillus sp. LMS25]UTR15994.1 PspC domain-containing protein [Salipaludibacillus sp. LMS25]
MKRLYRTSHDRKLAGICGGLGHYFNIDPTIVRIVLLFLIIPFNVGIILAYVIGIFVIPDEMDVA